jgi:hypothetical protein
MSNSPRISGCLCGAVQLSITGDPVDMTYCHCESCRRWLGAPVHASSLWPTENVQVQKGADLLATYKRTAESGCYRKFCTQCGVAVLIDIPVMGMTDIPAGSIADFVFRPTLHANYAEKVLSIIDGLPKYKGQEPQYGGTEELLPE